MAQIAVNQIIKTCMEHHYEVEYNDISYSDGFDVAEYEACIFINCHFESTKLGESKFIDCRFEECNMSSCDVHTAAFRNVQFNKCKMIGIMFYTCNAFGLSMKYDGCVLDYSVLTDMDLRKTAFENCSLVEVDLSNANLNKSKLLNCNLSRATFASTDLSYADLRESIGFDIDPRNNNVNRLRISRSEIEGLLRAYDLDLK